MNEKQRVLTVIALVAFVVIGACHYLAWPPLHLYVYKAFPLTLWKELTYEEAQQEVHEQNLDSLFIARLLEQGGYTDSKGTYYSYKKGDPWVDFSGIPLEAKVWFPVETRAWMWVWNPRLNVVTARNYAMIFDLRIPWFMLGVIYFGLFFLLSDRKEKR